MNRPVYYPSRFVRFGGRVVSDRAFNVKTIAEATMGSRCVLDCRTVGKGVNYLTTTVRPNGGAAGVFVVNMKTLFRQAQKGPLSKAMVEKFHPDNGMSAMDEGAEGLFTSEMVRQEVRLDTSDMKVMPMIREVETVTLFMLREGTRDRISAWQKTSSYLTRSDLKYVDAKGRPVDVRWYQLKYWRRSQ